jgi:hypothetical protein
MNKRVCFLILILFIIIWQTSFAQVTTQKDSLKKTHSPKLAMLLSVVPGLGQAYNKKYWKIPIIYAGMGTLGYFAYHNGVYYKKFKKTYSNLLSTGNADTTAYMYGVEFTLNGLETGKNYYRRYRDMFTIFTFGLYLMNIIDANVDAHLYDFDISDDLSLNITPSADYSVLIGLVPALKLTLKF